MEFALYKYFTPTILFSPHSFLSPLFFPPLYQPLCDNHDDGETQALILCDKCGNLCGECDRVLHYRRNTRDHQRQVCCVGVMGVDSVCASEELSEVVHPLSVMSLTFSRTQDLLSM